MDLVNDEDDVAQFLYLVDKALHPAFKLAPELGAGHQSGQVQKIDLFILKFVGHVPVVDAKGKALGNGGLAYARFTDEAGVIFLPAVQNLNGAGNLLVPADNVIQLAVGGFLGQGDTVIIQKLPFGVLGLAVFLFPALGRGIAARLFAAGRLLPRGGGGRSSPAKEFAEEGEGGSLALVLVVALLGGGHTLHPLGAAEGGHHLVGEILHIVLGKPHLLNHIVNGLDPKFPGAADAKAVGDGLAVFDALNKDDSHVFMASGTHSRLHLWSTPFWSGPVWDHPEGHRPLQGKHSNPKL